MNSPSAALIWEIWRKNRWGFALLLVLLAVCTALSSVVIGFPLIAVASDGRWMQSDFGTASLSVNRRAWNATAQDLFTSARPPSS